MMHTGKLLLITILLMTYVTSGEDDYESITTDINLAEFDLLDAYDEISEVTKNSFLGVQGFKEKIKAELQRGTILRQQYESNLNLETQVPDDLTRAWTLLTKSGDFLLQENDFKTLVEFHNTMEELSLHSKITCVNDNKDCYINKQDFEDKLSKSHNAFELLKLWQARQDHFVEHSHQFGSILNLVNKAYIPNGQHSSIAYWEMLTEYEDGYSKAKALWNEILPLYKKLHAFVKNRLYKYYGITSSSDLLPVYLLGTNFGNDWTNIANIVLPHPYLYTEINLELKHQTAKNLYTAAEKTAQIIGLGSLEATFFTNSIFNFSLCGPYIFTNCGLGQSEVFTCNKLDWSKYLNIYETTVDIALRSVNYESYPRMQLRFSIVDEALKAMGSLFAIADLSKNDLIPQDIFLQETEDQYNRKNTALLLLALKILPSLPYYLVADLWRLRELKFSRGNYTEEWWKTRNGVQGVQGLTASEPDFLADPYISSNKPYLSKFFGVLLQFQITDYYQKYFMTENETIVQAIRRDESFKKFIKDRPNKNWLELIKLYFGINEISSAALLEYFKPLEMYLDNAPKEQIVIPVTPNPRHTPKPSVSPTISSGFNLNGTWVLMDKNNETKDNKTTLNSDENVRIATARSNTFETLNVLSALIGLITVCVVILIVVHILKTQQKRHDNIKIYEGY